MNISVVGTGNRAIYIHLLLLKISTDCILRQLTAAEKEKDRATQKEKRDREKLRVKDKPSDSEKMREIESRRISYIRSGSAYIIERNIFHVLSICTIARCE